MEPRGVTVTGRRAGLATVFVLLGVATLCANAPWLRGFSQSTLLPLLLAATVVSCAIPPAVAYGLRRSPTASMAGSGVALIVFSVLSVGHNPVDLGRAIIHGPAAILTEALPITEPRWVLLVPVVACWITGAAASELATRGRSLGAPVVVWVLAFVLASAMTAGGSGDDVGWAALLLLASGCCVMLRRWLNDQAAADAGDERSLSLLPLVYGAITVVVLAAGCALAIPNLGQFRQTPAQLSRVPPVSGFSTESPPSAMATLRTERSVVPLFTVTSSVRVPGYVPIAQLDTYNGATWSLPSLFEPSGGVVPAAPYSSTSTTATPTGSFTLTKNWRLPWMPYLARPTQVSGLTVSYDPQSGMVLPEHVLITTGGYSVRATTAGATLDQLSARDLSLYDTLVSSDAADTEFPSDETVDVQKALASYEEVLGAKSAPTLSFLVKLAGYFQHDAQLNAAGPIAAGSTPPDLGLSFGDVWNQTQNKDASPEQFATMFVLLARAAHVPAQLVSGFRIGGADGILEPGHSYTATNRDAWTWAEVPVAHVGWVVVDPSPVKDAKQHPVTVGASPPTSTTSTVPPSVTASHCRGCRRAAGVVHVKLPPRPAGFPWALALIAVAVLLVAAALAVPSVLRARRRNRRRRGTSPRIRVVGAWQDSLETLHETRGIDTTGLTATEVVAATRENVGEEASTHVGTVATLSDRAIFSEHGELTPIDADTAWAANASLRRDATRSLRWRDRLVAQWRSLHPPV